ncbi:MAG: long-chain fatty acid--CoA ligase [Acidimicrobiia bacterium]|nr:long-chain fatty acid--CoA ligase [Acidimicrobiia bacterium]
MNLATLVTRAACWFGNRPAVIDGGRTMSFRELEERSNQFAHVMAGLGCRPGERVAVLLGNRLEWFDVTFGLLKAGLVRTYVNPRSAPPEIAHQLADSGARTVIVSDEFEGLLEATDLGAVEHVIRTGGEYDALLEAAAASAPGLDLGPDTLAALQYSSGTTGRPKGVMQTHGNWLAMTSGALIDIGVGPDDVLLHVGPMSHASGGFAYPFLYRGGTQVVYSGFDPVELLEAIPRHRVTTLLLVPTMIYALLEVLGRHPVDTSTLRTVLYGGSPIAPGKLEQCLEVLGPVFQQTYGMTEALGGDTFLHKHEHVPGSRRLASAGRPSFPVELTVADEQGHELPPGEVGEVVTRGPHVMAGYWNRPEASAEVFTPGGWFRTSDLGYLDEEGYLFIVDRKADMIVSGGFNVYPREVEDVLLAHPGIAEAAVVSTPDERWGESVRAVVRVQEGAGVTGEELDEWCRGQLAAFKVPRGYDFAAEPLPKNPNGKVLRRLIREPYWAGRERRVG